MVGIGAELICLVGDAVIVGVLYKLYQRCHDAVLQIKEAPSVSCGTELDDLLQRHEGNVAYVCVEGVASPVGRVLHSQYQDEVTGMVQKLLMVEHKSKRTQGFWSDVRKVLRDTVNTVPFVLSLPKTPGSGLSETEHQVHVTDPTSAELLLETLTETHDVFKPEESSVFSRGMDRLFGDVTKGIQETESMLPVGASMLGLGKVVIDSSKIQLVPPTNGAKYILTTLSKNEVLKALESRSFVYKVLVGVFGALGVALFAFWCRRMLLQWKERRDHERQQHELEIARLERASRRRRGSSSDVDTLNPAVEENHDDGGNCVICLTQGREVILLNCGHICVCADCAQELPAPRKCPICRGSVSRILPVYNV